MPDQSAPFVFERVVKIMRDDFIEPAALEVRGDFGFELPHNPEFVLVDDLIAAFVKVELALLHLKLGFGFQVGAVVGKKEAVTWVNRFVPV